MGAPNAAGRWAQVWEAHLAGARMRRVVLAAVVIANALILWALSVAVVCR